MGGLSNTITRTFTYLVVFFAVLVTVLSIIGVIASIQNNRTQDMWFFLFLLLFSIMSAWHFLKKTKGSVAFTPGTGRNPTARRGNMKNRQIKKEVARMMQGGVGKTQIFRSLVDRGAKEKMAAHYIASYSDERLGYEHEGKVKLLITIMFFQAFLAFLFGYVMGLEKHAQTPWLIGIFFTIIPLLLIWGFYRQSAMAYNAYLLLALIQIPKMLKGISETPIETVIILVINLGMIWFVMHIRSKLFPDFVGITPRRVKGRYVFSS